MGYRSLLMGNSVRNRGWVCVVTTTYKVSLGPSCTPLISHMASGIPNLLTSRNARQAGRGHGRGRGGPDLGIDEDAEALNAKKDGIVQQTDQDASISRMSAVEAGYLEDPFAELFAVPGAQRRFPIINRGISYSKHILLLA